MIYSRLTQMAPDGLLAVIAQFDRDPRTDKIDLGLGVYRDADAATPVMRAVKLAETQLLANQNTKTYLGAAGDPQFTRLVAATVFGEELAENGRLAGLQTPCGTGALRLGAELIERAHPGSKVWLSTPTWPNHASIFSAAGLPLCHHRFFNPETSELDFAGMMEDLAYHGLGEGLDDDAWPTRIILESNPSALLAYSCDKNFVLYRERVGALWTWSTDTATASCVLSNVLALSRALWSMPPDHGAAAVRIILECAELRAEWAIELSAMRKRLNDLRTALGAVHHRLAPIAKQQGLFALLPIALAAVAALRDAHGIYLAGDGRMNVAGLTNRTLSAFVLALPAYLPEEASNG